jgi:O-acetyl-ADP-ribose deacetylase (regulator of RNase III)
MWRFSKPKPPPSYVWEYKGMKLVNQFGDITKELGMITNAANEHLMHGGGVAGAISRAGGHAIDSESRVWCNEHDG